MRIGIAFSSLLENLSGNNRFAFIPFFALYIMMSSNKVIKPSANRANHATIYNGLIQFENKKQTEIMDKA